MVFLIFTGDSQFTFTCAIKLVLYFSVKNAAVSGFEEIYLCPIQEIQQHMKESTGVTYKISDLESILWLKQQQNIVFQSIINTIF